MGAVTAYGILAGAAHLEAILKRVSLNGGLAAGSLTTQALSCLSQQLLSCDLDRSCLFVLDLNPDE